VFALGWSRRSRSRAVPAADIASPSATNLISMLMRGRFGIALPGLYRSARSQSVGRAECRFRLPAEFRCPPNIR